MWRPFWAFQRACTRSGSWAGRQRRLTSALLHSAFLYHLRKTRLGRYNQDASMAGRYGARVYIRNPCVPSYHSAATSGGDHIALHIEKKHHPTRSEGKQLLWWFAGQNSKKDTTFQCVFDLCSLFFVLCSFMHRFWFSKCLVRISKFSAYFAFLSVSSINFSSDFMQCQ